MNKLQNPCIESKKKSNLVRENFEGTFFPTNNFHMAQREILLEKMLKVLKDIETNTCDKEFLPNTTLLEKKLDQLIELHKQQVLILKEIMLLQVNSKESPERSIPKIKKKVVRKRKK
jgi:hypothetical protein